MKTEKKSTIDWTKIPTGTKVYVRDNTDQDWKLRIFAVYKENSYWPFGCFGDLSASASGSIVWWKYAKLMEE